jgi:pyruvate dehydrogenase E2 component (dihydrolipoamide acetyltransferase)
VALDQVEPSGPGGRVTPEDVKAQAEGDQKKSQKEKETPAAVKPAETEGPELPDFSQWGEVERTPLRSIRRATAKRMALAWSEIPHVTHEDLADITELEKFRQDNKDDIDNQGGALTLTVFAIKAAVAALKAYPRFNASLDIEAGEIISKKYFHIGVAVDTDRGLLVPVVRDADCKSMVELAREVTELAERTRRGEVEPRDMSGGTFTITNVGPLGGTGFTPIINFPQVAILGLAKARLQPMIRGDINDFDVVPRLMLPLVLGFDHRIVDGADAARFLGEVIRLLESPENLMLSQ